jgi:hypothetical protein
MDQLSIVDEMTCEYIEYGEFVRLLYTLYNTPILPSSPETPHKPLDETVPLTPCVPPTQCIPSPEEENTPPDHQPSKELLTLYQGLEQYLKDVEHVESVARRFHQEYKTFTTHAQRLLDDWNQKAQNPPSKTSVIDWETTTRNISF